MYVLFGMWYEDTESEDFKIMLEFPALWWAIAQDKETYDLYNGEYLV